MSSQKLPVEGGCRTEAASLRFDFPAASHSQCVVDGEREFTVLVTPEHAPPINPSPWYAFRYTSAGSGALTVHLTYLGAKHRYAPKLERDGMLSEVPVTVSDDRRSATVNLPAGAGIVSAQPIVAARHYAAFAQRLAREAGGERIELGRSHDRRPIEALRLGEGSAPRLIVILGRQHPPEVTGTYALEAFVEELAQLLHGDPALRRRYQVLAVPLLNPDGVENGHWRANRGGVDLNRDWGPFTQPETKAVRQWLADHAVQATPIAMIDFHSTDRNLFYVQGEEADPANRRFRDAWLGGKEGRFAGYPFTIETRNANPGTGTAKNWFFACFTIPAYTFEVGDATDRLSAESAARILARELVPSLEKSTAEIPNGHRHTDPTCLR